jgi:hypothetical protein
MWRTRAGYVRRGVRPALLTGSEKWAETWIPIIRRLLKRGIRILGFFNNHYAGFVPGSIKLFHQVWERMGAAEE